MEPFSLFMMGFGGGLEGYSRYRQAKKEAEYLEQMAAEIKRQRRYTEQVSLEEQHEVLRARDIDIGRAYGQAAKAGVRTGTGSTKKRRQAVSEAYGRQRETIQMKYGEQIQQMDVQRRLLLKQAKDIKKASKWNLLTSLLGTGFNVGYGAYKLGMFSNLFNRGSEGLTPVGDILNRVSGGGSGAGQLISPWLRNWE